MLAWFSGQFRYAWTTCPRVNNFDFQSGTKFIFSCHGTRMKFCTKPEGEFHLQWKLEWTCSGITRVERKWVLCNQIQRNIWRWNELIPEWKSFRYRVNNSEFCSLLAWWAKRQCRVRLVVISIHKNAELLF